VLGPHRSDYFPPWPDAIPRPTCILDLGAHHGLYAAAALHEFPAARIISVEPSAAALSRLRTNLALNGGEQRARVVPAGLAPERGTGVLRHTEEGTWGASLYEDAAHAVDSETVTLMTLSEILGDDRPQIIKCNAEGAEYSLFDQLEASDLRPQFMLVMVHPDFGDLAHLLSQADTMGYRVTRRGTADHPAFQMWKVPTDGERRDTS
jgi:FkbM family methyltransferase